MPLTPAGEQARNPRFSPDGERVVYQRRSGEQWDLWLLELATGEQRPLTTSPYDEREPDFTPRRPRRRLRDQSHRALLPVVDHARRRRRDPTDRRDRRRLVSDRLRARARGLRARARRRVVDPRARQRRRDHVVHTSSSRLSAPTWRPGGGVLVFGEQDSAETSRLQLLAARRAARVEVAERQRGSVRVARRLAVRGRVHLRGGRAALAARHRDADTRARPSLRGGRGRGRDHRRPICRRSTTPGGALGARRQRPRTIARRPEHGFHGVGRSVARGPRRAAPAHGRRVRRPRSELLARRRVGGVRERAHGPVRAVAAHVARRQARRS